MDSELHLSPYICRTALALRTQAHGSKLRLVVCPAQTHCARFCWTQSASYTRGLFEMNSGASGRAPTATDHTRSADHHSAHDVATPAHMAGQPCLVEQPESSSSVAPLASTVDLSCLSLDPADCASPTEPSGTSSGPSTGTLVTPRTDVSSSLTGLRQTFNADSCDMLTARRSVNFSTEFPQFKPKRTVGHAPTHAALQCLCCHGTTQFTTTHITPHMKALHQIICSQRVISSAQDLRPDAREDKSTIKHNCEC